METEQSNQLATQLNRLLELTARMGQQIRKLTDDNLALRAENDELSRKLAQADSQIEAMISRYQEME